MEAVINDTPKKRRSVALTADEKKSFKKLIDSFKTVVECAEVIGIHRNVLDRVILTGSGSPETVEKIRAVLAQDGENAN